MALHRGWIFFCFYYYYTRLFLIIIDYIPLPVYYSHAYQSLPGINQGGGS